MDEIARPNWWRYPHVCSHGHAWGPGRVRVGWMPCDCEAAQGNHMGHRWVRCREPGCPSIWYEPKCEAADAALVIRLPPMRVKN